MLIIAFIVTQMSSVSQRAIEQEELIMCGRMVISRQPKYTKDG